jgi:hypothetical protein
MGILDGNVPTRVNDEPQSVVWVGMTRIRSAANVTNRSLSVVRCMRGNVAGGSKTKAGASDCQ